MFERVGHLVEKIKRVQLGPLVLDVGPGKYRALTEREVEQLKKTTGAARSRPAIGAKNPGKCEDEE
jgi:23S rRNA pseudouridine2605 synthase